MSDLPSPLTPCSKARPGTPDSGPVATATPPLATGAVAEGAARAVSPTTTGQAATTTTMTISARATALVSRGQATGRPSRRPIATAWAAASLVGHLVVEAVALVVVVAEGRDLLCNR